MSPPNNLETRNSGRSRAEGLWEEKAKNDLGQFAKNRGSLDELRQTPMALDDLGRLWTNLTTLDDFGRLWTISMTLDDLDDFGRSR